MIKKINIRFETNQIEVNSNFYQVILFLSQISYFSVRNAGNLIPHSQHFVDELTMCEPAALELGCVINDIRHIIVCGHSDCKAMNLLYALRDEEFASKVCI